MNDPKKLASKGRYGDTMLAHINPEEAALLKSRGGAGTINPKTGLPEFYMYAGYGLSDQATLDAQKAAEKAATKKAAGPAPPPALTAEQRQANIARDLALSQTRGGRPSSQDSQFYQPAYQPQYNNYVNPLLSSNVSTYGTNPGPSAGYMAAMAPGGQGLSNYYQSLQQFGAQQSNQPYGMDYAAFNPARKAMGASQGDLMAAYGYNPMQNQMGYGGGYQGYMPQMQSPFGYQQPMQQMQTPFSSQASSGNTLTPEIARSLIERSMTKSGAPNSEFDRYGGYDKVSAMYETAGGNYKKPTSPSMAGQPTQFNPYSNSYGIGMPQMQTPFSYQQPQYQQMQTPFSYQQPMQQPMSQRTSGPSQAIVGRSSQMRGTPNVVRRAEGGIASLLKKDK